MKDRFHGGLPNSKVKRANCHTICFEAASRLGRKSGWNLVGARNEWFQRRAIRALNHSEPFARKNFDETHRVPVLFVYSYAALGPIRWAKERGWRTVLGQIDPGIEEEKLLVRRYGKSATGNAWRTAPPDYWANWHEECELADRIVVNSIWSRDLLIKAGISAAKLCVVPLAYDDSTHTPPRKTTFPETFTSANPLKVLFLGQLSVRKGVLELLEAAELLLGQPVQFHFVGSLKLSIPTRYHALPHVFFHGSVPRSEVLRWYDYADVFLFPTHSDGFGLTQLEAVSNGLPVIASQHCGDVVHDGYNGRRLSRVTGECIAHRLTEILNDPSLLDRWSRNCSVENQFSLASVGRALLRCVS